MMEHFSMMVDAPKLSRTKVSDTIYTLDIETTSLFQYPDGWGVFDYSIDADVYKDFNKAAVPYIWQAGIEADGKCNVYYGREFKDIEHFFKTIADPEQRKIIWVFNLGYEMQFLRDIFQHYTITKMCCRQMRKPIRFILQELNLEFRCAYMLTGLSLEKAAEQYTTLEKLTGDLDYNQVRSPLTKLSEDEKAYCEMDIRTLQAIIEHYRKDYGKLSAIPLTLTGEVRKELRDSVDMQYIYNIRKQVPQSAHIQALLMRAFMGGITHACYLYSGTGHVYKDICSWDMASAYPAVMLSERYPSSRWIKITPEGANKADRKYWAALYHVTFTNIESKMFNNYILASKAVDGSGVQIDNGRLIRADHLRMVLTSVDFDIILQCYDIDSIEYHECYINRMDYLPIELRKYVIKLYKRKTELKGVKGAEDEYRRSKTRCNSLFGCACTNIIKSSADYVNGEWTVQAITDEFMEEKLDELRNSRTNCFAYSWGVFITSYCRRRTWEMVSALDPTKEGVGLDKGVLYYDTDSIKAPYSKAATMAVEKSNREFMDKLREMCQMDDINIEDTCPLDPKGKPHQIGLWENESGTEDGCSYSEFITLGAKRYAHRDKEDGVLNITVSGVKAKSGRRALEDDIYNFRDNMTFGYEECGKMTSYYNDCQPVFTFTDKDGNEYTSTQEHGIILQPTTYHMGIDDVYEALWSHDFTYNNYDIKDGKVKKGAKK